MEHVTCFLIVFQLQSKLITGSTAAPFQIKDLITFNDGGTEFYDSLYDRVKD